MVPKKLIMEGFISFYKRTEIDFTKLKDESIYLITGPTGSGKTTIFDAITYALFGEATGQERKSTKAYKSHLSNEGDPFEVSLEFTQDGIDYLVRRYIKKGNKTLKTHLSWQGKEVTKDVTKEIEKIVGLNMDQFKKIVMLPQGEFRNFLNAAPKEKGEILRKLFNTESYEEIKDRFKVKSQILNKSMEDFDRMIEEEKSKWEASKNLLDYDEIVGELEKDLGDKNLMQRRLKEDSKGLEEGINNLVRELEKAFENEKKIREYKDNLNKLSTLEKDKAIFLAYKEKSDKITEIKPLIIDSDNIKILKVKKDNVEKELKEIKVWLNNNEERFNYLSKKIKEEPYLEERKENLIKEVQSLKNKISIRNEFESNLLILERMKEEEEDYKFLKDKKEILNKEASKLNEDFRTSNNRYMDLSDSISSKRDELLELREGVKVLDELIEELLLTKTKEEEIEGAKENSKNILTLLEACKRELDLLKEDKKKAGLLNYLDLLKEGEPCPLCGSLDHSNEKILDAHVIDDNEVKIKEEEYFKLNRKLIEEEAKLDLLIKEVDEGDIKIIDLWRAIRVKLANSQEIKIFNLEGENYKNDKEKAIREIITISKDLQLRGENISNGINELRALIGKEEENLKLLRMKIENNSHEDALVKKKLSDYEELMERATKAQYFINTNKIHFKEGETSRILNENLARLEIELINLRKEITEIRQEYNLLEGEMNKRKTKGETLVENYDNLIEEIKEREVSFISNLVKLKITEEDFHVLKGEVHKEKEYRSLYEGFIKQYERLSYLVEEGHRQTKDLDGKRSEEFLEEIENLKLKKDSIDDELSRSLRVLFDLEKSIEAIKEGKKFIEDNRQRANILKRLSEITSRGLTFENYVLSYYLDGVLVNANRRLRKMTADRYILVRHKDETIKLNEIQGLNLNIFDSYSNRERLVGTLSGGESFKASLALALGLSDFIAENLKGKKLGTLFIDEGFGTLDQDSLDIAIETLMELTDIGRNVAVISHVEELKERIRARIELSQSRGEGSKVKIVI